MTELDLVLGAHSAMVWPDGKNNSAASSGRHGVEMTAQYGLPFKEQRTVLQTYDVFKICN